MLRNTIDIEDAGKEEGNAYVWYRGSRLRSAQHTGMKPRTLIFDRALNINKQ